MKEKTGSVREAMGGSGRRPAIELRGRRDRSRLRLNMLKGLRDKIKRLCTYTSCYSVRLECVQSRQELDPIFSKFRL